jgi:exonuclease III
MNRSSRQKLNREIMELTDVMNLTDIYRTFHRNTKVYTFFSASHRAFSKIDHILVLNTRKQENKIRKLK